MGRRNGLAIHGWLIIDKPIGLTSTAVVSKVRRATGAAKVGHGGTLDPLASGVLPIALGEATKTVSYAMDGDKTYHFRVRWGVATATDDGEGEITTTSPVRPSAQEIEQALPAFEGDVTQVPPIFSAVKIDGKRAYDLARSHQEVEMKPRLVRIDQVRLLGLPDQDHADFEASCGKGTYIRALARDLALALGTVGHVVRLRRMRVGAFYEKDAISLEKLAELGHSAPASEHLLPIETVLDDIPALALTEAEAQRLKCGQSVSLLKLAARMPLSQIPTAPVVRAMEGNKLVALARIEDGEVRSIRVFNL
ncbi:MAG: tRNA pseudouridine(55) synthase TruB [Alphaproteobacteria bacterium]|nr:tRNA pseudouridine(55) synthase TruB [Alphaproteobacteria bacterium]